MAADTMQVNAYDRHDDEDDNNSDYDDVEYDDRYDNDDVVK